MATFIVFDTETTGLPPRYNATLTNWQDWDRCRCVQLAWEIHPDLSGVNPVVERRSYLIRPDNFAIPKEATNIHGITTECARKQGLEFKQVLDIFMSDIAKHAVRTAVAHNMQFDDNVLLAEMYRLEKQIVVDTWRSLSKECTMRMGTKPGGRWPKLADLYTNLCGQLPSDTCLHDAGCDAMLCALVYIKLKNV